MAAQIERVIYYRSILNVLNVVESCPKNLKKCLKDNEYRQALAVLDYNSQWVGFKSLDEASKGELIALAKDAAKRQKIREIVDTLVKKKKALTVEEIIKQAGD